MLLHMAIQGVLTWQDGAETYCGSNWTPCFHHSVLPNSGIFKIHDFRHSWIFHGSPWGPMGTHGDQWGPHGNPWRVLRNVRIWPKLSNFLVFWAQSRLWQFLNGFGGSGMPYGLILTDFVNMKIWKSEKLKNGKSGNLKIWKRRAPKNDRDLSGQKCFNFRGVLIGE